jgi:cysteinyl-tRNA synthetase
VKPEEAAAARGGLHFMLGALGLTLPPIIEEAAADVPLEIQSIAQRRWDAKQAKDWPAADALRKELETAGWLVKDGKDGYTIIPK